MPVLQKLLPEQSHAHAAIQKKDMPRDNNIIGTTEAKHSYHLFAINHDQPCAADAA